MIQPRQLQLPTQRDPLARLALFALVGVACWLALSAPAVPTAAQAEAFVIATPTIGILPTQAPTAAPIVVQAAPTVDPPTNPPAPTAEPVVIERQIIVEVTAPPQPTDPPAPSPTAPLMVLVPGNTIIVIATPETQSDAEFIASFGPTPDPNARCAFVGCLPQP